MKRGIFVFLVGSAFTLAALVTVRTANADITVTKARIGCLPIQPDGNLTALVAQACNGKSSCAYKAPTEDGYKRAGVHAATRAFCTQGMEISYQCGDGQIKNVSVPGDAWDHPPAELACAPAGVRPMVPFGPVLPAPHPVLPTPPAASSTARHTAFDPTTEGFNFDNTFENIVNLPAGVNVRTGGLVPRATC